MLKLVDNACHWWKKNEFPFFVFPYFLGIPVWPGVFTALYLLLFVEQLALSLSPLSFSFSVSLSICLSLPLYSFVSLYLSLLSSLSHCCLLLNSLVRDSTPRTRTARACTRMPPWPSCCLPALTVSSLTLLWHKKHIHVEFFRAQGSQAGVSVHTR